LKSPVFKSVVSLQSAFRLLSSFALLLTSTWAGAFPEMIGRGYDSCRACHYNTGGGGPTTAYGKGIAEEISTWSREREGEAFYGLVDVSPLGLHGDMRYLAYRYEDDTVVVQSRFPMQRELSLSLDASKNISLLMSCGHYGYGNQAEQLECRSYAASLSAGPLRFRGGRFLPVFGINIPDHTKAIKELFGQGKESLNAEFSVVSRFFEVIYTRAYGRSDTRIKGDNSPSVLTRSDGDGFTLKTSLFLARGLQVGYSFAEITEDGGSTIDRISGYHAFFGTPKLAVMAEYQQHPLNEVRGYGMIGLQPLRGLWFKGEIDYRRALPDAPTDPEIFGTVQWMPRPHLEFLVSGSEKRVIFISHYYL